MKTRSKVGQVSPVKQSQVQMSFLPLPGKNKTIDVQDNSICQGEKAVE
jgi:hypothetical protein